MNLEASCHLNGPSLAQQILICCDKILFCHTQRGYQFLFLDYFFFFFFCYFTFINFLQKSFYYYYFIIFFFLKIIFIFSCSGVFRDVPECSGFYRRPFIIYILRNTHQKAMLEIFVRRLVLANQRSERWFSHVKKMIRPIRIANDVFSRVRKMIRPIRSHRGVWVSRQNSRLLLQLAAPLRTHSTRKVYSKSISR